MQLKTIIYLLGLALGSFCNAQSQVFYNKQTLKNSFFNIVEQTNSSNYIITNNSQGSFNNYAFYNSACQLLKINSLGNLTDSLTLDTNVWVNSGIVPIGNFYYLFTSEVKYYGSYNYASLQVMLKYDANFNLILKKRIDSLYNHSVTFSKVLSKNNRVYMVYSTTPTDSTIRLYKFDYNLNTLATATLTGDLLYDAESFENGLLLCGVKFPQATSVTPNQVAELDTLFNVVSRFNVDSLTFLSNCGQTITSKGTVVNLSALGNNKYLISGYDAVVSCQPNGPSQFKTLFSIIKNNNRVLQTHIVAKPGFENLLTVNGQTSSRRFNSAYTVGYVGNASLINIPSNAHTFLSINKIDTSGALVWTKYFGGDMYYFPVSVYASKDSGAIICGLRYDSVAPKRVNVGEAFVLKVDKNGNQLFVGIKENGRINTHYHKCYPNPANNSIQFDVPFQTNMEVIIYDLFGRQQLCVKDYTNLSPLTISELGPGTYSYRIKTTTGVFSGKFVKD